MEMKYQDNPNRNEVNGIPIGERVGTPLMDVLAPEDDGNEHIRGIIHVGTVCPDAADPMPPQPIED